MVRSGCLRKPVPERVDFIHRTFQEYLAAARIVEIDDFDNLLANAHLDQWHEVFVMAVGHARPKERSILLSGLIKRGETDPEHKKRLHLLAAACLETATECNPPTIYNQVREITAELIPRVALRTRRNWLRRVTWLSRSFPREGFPRTRQWPPSGWRQLSVVMAHSL